LKLALIVAAARNNVIGRNNTLPWHLPQDLKYFKSVTLGKPIIMGRKTYESIGRPLPGRVNIVITRQSGWMAEGVKVASDLTSAIAFAQQALSESTGSADEAMIIGGAEIYRSSIELVQRIYLTRINADIDGDAFFPELDSHTWRQVSVTSGDAGSSLAHEFQIFERLDQ
jgi:dihydrofolate reductase